MMVDKWIKTIVALLALLFALSMGITSARAENQSKIGTDIGFLADAADDTVFTLNFQESYFPGSSFSVDLQLLISSAGDFTQGTFA